jgi:hypothetical protein
LQHGRADAGSRRVRGCQITTYRKDGIFDLPVEKQVIQQDDLVRNDRLAEGGGEEVVSGVAQYDFRTGPPPSVPVGAGAGSGGGDMDDVLRRLGSLERDVSTIKADVTGITGLLPYLATKADVAPLPYMATKADVSDVKTSIIQWIVATMIAAAALAFTIAKFVH